MKVLIVDPSRAVTFTLAALFGKNGFDYCATRTGAEALGLLSRETVDVLCFAYELADMNGIEFIVAARARKLVHAQPCLLLVSSQLDRIGSKALSAGVTECFWKRDREKLERFVERFADSHVRRITGKTVGACHHDDEFTSRRLDMKKGTLKLVVIMAGIISPGLCQVAIAALAEQGRLYPDLQD